MAQRDERRAAPLPDELEAALAADSEARARFDGLSESHRREYVDWIAEAKRAETREGRSAKALEMLKEDR